MLNFLVLFVILNLFLYLNLQKISKILNIYDYPEKRKLHSKPVPLLGGLFSFINLFFAIIYFWNPNLIFFYCGYFSFFILGLIDDKFNISATKKFLISIIILSIIIIYDKNLILSNLKLSFINQEINIGLFGYFFSIICFLLFINSLNMFDGINLQSSLYSIILATYLIYLDFYTNILFVVIIALLFFLYWNYKSKIFLGDSGALSIGFIFSYFFILAYKQENILYADKIYTAMYLPGLELMRMYLERIFKGRSPFKPDRNHIHHLLLDRYGYNRCLIIILFLIIVPIVLDELLNKTLLINIIFLIIYLYLIYFHLKKKI